MILYALALLALLVLGDATLTIIGLADTGVSDVNPLLAFGVSAMIAIKLGAATIAIALLWNAGRHMPRVTLALVALMCLVFVAVDLNNITILLLRSAHTN